METENGNWAGWVASRVEWRVGWREGRRVRGGRWAQVRGVSRKQGSISCSRPQSVDTRIYAFGGGGIKIKWRARGGVGAGGVGAGGGVKEWGGGRGVGVVE